MGVLNNSSNVNVMLAREFFKDQKFAVGQLFTLTSVMKKLVNMVFWMLRGGARSDGVKCTEVKFFEVKLSFLMTKFQDVWKLTALCRLFHSSSFGASIPEFWPSDLTKSPEFNASKGEDASQA